MNRALTAAVTILQLAAWAGVAGGDHPELILRVINEANVTPSLLSKAEKEAGFILGKAGVEVSWLNCHAGFADWSSHDPCQELARPGEFDIMIVRHKPAMVHAAAIGFAVLPGKAEDGPGYGAVNYPYAVQVAAARNIESYEIIAAAIAHEVGHLLLGARAHSPHGIMSDPWRSAEFGRISLGELLFTSEQAPRLRQAISQLNASADQRAAAAAASHDAPRFALAH